jgi:spore germination protein YaaH/PKD repeat protein
MKKIIALLLFTAIFQVNYAQESYPSIHQQELEYYNSLNLTTSAQFDSATQFGGVVSQAKNAKTCTLQKMVFGWNPYWMTSQYQNFQWNLISDFCYFSYEFVDSTGAVINSHSFATAASVTAALNNGKRVHLTTTLFSNHAKFLTNSTAQQTLITNLISAVKQRGATGINVDFEGVPAAQKTNFTSFMKTLSQRLHDSIPNSLVSICLPAVDWSSSYDVVNMNNDVVASRNVDLFIIMGYDYYYGGSTTAGPTDPLYPYQTSATSCLSKTFTNYANKVPTSKLVMGLPNYGRQWKVTAAGLPGTTVSGTGTSKTYKQIKDNTSGYYSAANAIWNNDAFSNCYQFQIDTSWYQCFVNNPYSWGRRLDMVSQRDYAGIGIWALGNDDGYTELWDKISQKFSSCATMACTDSIFDMGGPTRNYFDGEQYSYTIQPTGATGLNLTFTDFFTEAGYDTLFVYNGNSTASPLIGAYQGMASPGSITASGNALTLRFKSDGATNKSGWKAIWSCSIDNMLPTTTIDQADSLWVTANYTANFTDADNVGGSGIDRKFYQVMYNDGTTWTANQNRGYAVDNFDSFDANKWKVPSGNVVWSVSANALQVLDTNTDNSNIYSALNGTLSNTYIYDFYAKVDGLSTAKRFGFHFACDSATLTNRGNSYFIYIRPGSSQLEFYRVANNTFTQTSVVTGVVTNLNQYYHYKIVHNRISGLIEVFRDDVLLGSWTDPTPLATPSKYFSFRTARTQMWVKSMRVCRTRTSAVPVTVGNGDTDIPIQSKNGSVMSKIKSLVVDNNNNYSTLVSKEMRVDWSKPTTVSVIDGSSGDLDVFGTQGIIRGSWTTAIDTNSGIQRYQYAVGTTPGAANIVGWTDNSLNTSFEKTGLTLVDGTTYYIMVKSQNGAGLWSDSSSSDGAVFHLQPIADFSANTQQICTGSSVQYTNLSANIIGQTWFFNGGSPATSTAANPTVTYASAGNYEVKLVVTGMSGADSVIRSNYITVQATPSAPSIVSNPTICQGSTTQLEVSGSATLTWYTSISGGTALGTGTTLNTAALEESTSYYVRSEIGTCLSSMTTINVMVEPMPATPALSSPTPICSGTTTQITATGTATIKWNSDNLANNLVYTGASITTSPLTETTTYYVRTETANCITPMNSVTVEVIPALTAPQVALNHSICSGDSLLLHAESEAEVLWYHRVGDAPFLSGSNFQTSSMYQSDTVYVRAQSTGCFSDFVEVVIHVFDLPATPVITLANDQLCSDSPLENHWFYNGLPLDSIHTSCFYPTAEGDYSVRVTNENNCNSNFSNTIHFNHVGINGYSIEPLFTISPNPTSDKIILEWAKSNQITRIQLMNAIGEVVVSEMIPSGLSKWNIDVSQWANSIYYVKLINGEKQEVHPFVKTY